MHSPRKGAIKELQIVVEHMPHAQTALQNVFFHSREQSLYLDNFPKENK